MAREWYQHSLLDNKRGLTGAVTNITKQVLATRGRFKAAWIHRVQNVVNAVMVSLVSKEDIVVVHCVH